MRIARFTHAAIFAAALGVAAAAPSFAQSTNSQTFEGWANDTAVKSNGRISRDSYMNEMGRRWDADTSHSGTRDVYLKDLGTRWDKADRDNRGLTPAQLSEMSGKVDSSSSGMPKSGSGVQPGNMGPANAKGQ